MLTDPIANFLNRIRNSSHARQASLRMRSSKMIQSIAEMLAAKRFIDTAYVEEGDVVVTLRHDREPLTIKRMSKPGQRIYLSHDQVRRVRSGLGIGIISTSQGLMTDAEARKAKVGGEYIAEIF